jgi:hypothetical protein
VKAALEAMIKELGIEGDDNTVKHEKPAATSEAIMYEAPKMPENAPMVEELIQLMEQFLSLITLMMMPQNGDIAGPVARPTMEPPIHLYEDEA